MQLSYFDFQIKACIILNMFNMKTVGHTKLVHDSTWYPKLWSCCSDFKRNKGIQSRMLVSREWIKPDKMSPVHYIMIVLIPVYNIFVWSYTVSAINKAQLLSPNVLYGFTVTPWFMFVLLIKK